MSDEKPIPLDDKKFALYAKPTEGGKGPPKMSFSVYRGNPAIIVFPNDPNDSESKPIRAAMDMLSWGSFIELIHTAADGAPGTKYRVANKKGPPKNTFIDTVTHVGKDDEGVVYIAVTQKERAQKRFDVVPGMYTELLDGEGNPLDRGTTSQIFAKGFARTLDNVVQYYMRERYEPPQQQGGNRGGGNRGGGQSGGGSWNSGGGQNVDDLL